MISPIELAISCAVLAGWSPGPGGDEFPVTAISAAEADAEMASAMFVTESILDVVDSRITIGPADGPPESMVANNWISGTTYGWSLSWDASLQELSMEVRETAWDSKLVEWSIPLESLSGMLFHADTSAASVSVDNWVLDGIPIASDLYVDAVASRMDLLLTNLDLEQTWRLKGDLTFHWSDSMPQDASSVFAIYGLTIPAPAGVLVLLIPLVGGRRRRS